MVNFAKKHPILTSAFAGVNLLASVASFQQGEHLALSSKTNEDAPVAMDAVASTFEGLSCVGATFNGSADTFGCRETVTANLGEVGQYVTHLVGIAGTMAGGLAGGTTGFVRQL